MSPSKIWHLAHHFYLCRGLILVLFSMMHRYYRVITFGIISLAVVGCTSTQPHQRNLTKALYYTIKKGDTLYSIGFRSGHGYRRLASWNKISPPYRVYPGQKLKLFSASTQKKNQNKYKSRKKTSVIAINNKNISKLYWQWPVQGKIVKSFYATGNKGIDIAGYIGKKIRAVESGIVVYSGNGLVGYGNLLIIKHNYLYLSAYAHNRRLHVKEGDKVKKGQLIAEMGARSDAKPILHFEIRKNGNSVNPVNYLPK